MKKLISVILAVLLCISLAGCSGSSGVNDIPSPTNNITLRFLTYNDWLNYKDVLAKEEADQLQQKTLLLEINAKHDASIDFEAEKAKLPPWDAEEQAELQKFYDMRKKQTLAVPCINGQPIELLDTDGIIWTSSETFQQPWTWFRNSNELMIRIAFLPDAALTDGKLTGLKAVQYFNPDMPSPSNYLFKKGYKKVYEKNIQLSDRKVTALFYEHTDDTRSDIYFVYDNMLVRFRSDLDLTTADWFKHFSFEVLDEDLLKTVK